MTQKVTPSQRLAAIRESLGLSLSKFAAPLGVSHSAVARWEAGEVKVSRKVALNIKDCYGVPVDWLLYGIGEMMVADMKNIAYPESKDSGEASGNLVMVPILSATPCAGDGNTLDHYVGEIGGRGFDDRWLRDSFLVPPKNLCLLRVVGDSMMPTINPDEMVFVDNSTTQDFFREGIWVLRVDDQLYVKRVQRSGHNQYQATSDNAVYRPIDLDESTQLLGRVVGILKRC